MLRLLIMRAAAIRLAGLASAFALLLPASAIAQPPISADLRLIKRLGPDAYRDEPYQAPYLAVFARGKKLLVFVSGDHTDGIDSFVAKTVRKAIFDFQPQAVVVEGLTANDREAERDWLKQATWFAQNNPKRLPENYYPAYLAHQRGIAFVGGEPSTAEKLKALNADGYNAEDLLGLRAALDVGAYTKEGPLDAKTLARRLDGPLTREARKMGLEKDFTYADYERWYAAHGIAGKPANELTALDCKPSAEPGANFLQRLGYALELVRENSVVRQIEGKLNRHDRVLVVYGSGHLVRQREVWKQALGPSRDSKPF